MRHHHSYTHTHTHTRRRLLALTADDCPWFRCFSEAENLAQRHAPFHIHDVVFAGSKFNRESRRSCAQSRGDGLATAPLNQAVSCKYTARLRWHPFGHVVTQTGSCCLLRKKRRKPARRGEETGPFWLLSPPRTRSGCERRTDEATCYFPIAD